MAKKNYSKIKLDYVPTTVEIGENTEFTFFGSNTRGTKQRLKIEIPNWMFKTIAQKMREIIAARASKAINDLQSYENAATARKIA